MNYFHSGSDPPLPIDVKFNILPLGGSLRSEDRRVRHFDLENRNYPVVLGIVHVAIMSSFIRMPGREAGQSDLVLVKM